MSERESFETWWERKHNNGNPPRFGWQHWRSGDGYLVDDDETEFQWRWEAWQASMEALKAEQKAGDAWIACADRMPEIEGHYLVWAKASMLEGYCDHQAMATYQGGEWSNDFNWLVTHWMPLPSPPAINHHIDTTSQQYEALSKGESK